MTGRPGMLRGSRVPAVALGLGVSALFVYLTVRKLHAADVLAGAAAADLSVLWLALVTKMGCFLIATWRSQLLFRPLHAFAFPRLFKSLLLAFAGNNVLPLRLGEVARIEYLARDSGLPRGACLTVVGLERLLDVLVLVLIFLAVLPAIAVKLPLRASFFVLVAGIGISVAAALWVSRHPEIFVRFCGAVAGLFGESASGFVARQSRSLAAGLAALHSVPLVAAVLLLSTAFWCFAMLGIRIWFLAFGLDLPWYAPLVVLGFLAFGTAIPSSPGYVGTYHYFVVLALGVFGVQASKATSVAIVGHALAVIPFTLLSLPLLFRDFRRRCS